MVGEYTQPTRLRRIRPMTLLVLLPASARAGIVSPHLRRVADDRCDFLRNFRAFAGMVVDGAALFHAGGRLKVFGHSVAAGVFVDGGGFAVLAARFDAAL